MQAREGSRDLIQLAHKSNVNYNYGKCNKNETHAFMKTSNKDRFVKYRIFPKKDLRPQHEESIN